MRTPGKWLLSPPPDDRLVTRRESAQQKHCKGVHTRKKDWTHPCDCCNANARTVLLADHDTRDGWVASRWVGCIKIGGRRVVLSRGLSSFATGPRSSFAAALGSP